MAANRRRQDTAKMIIVIQLPGNSVGCEQLIDQLAMLRLENPRDFRRNANNEVIKPLPVSPTDLSSDGIAKARIRFSRGLDS